MFSIHGICVYPERQVRMNERFNSLNLKINWLANPVTTDDPRNILHNIPCALMLNHLQCIRDFLTTGYEYGIICEDDVHLRKTFNDDALAAIDGFKRLKLDVLLLGYLSNYIPFDTKVSPEHKALETPFAFLSVYKDLWGSQMYMINRESGEKILKCFNDPYMPTPFSADWTITKFGKCACLYPMLAVEEGSIKASSDVHAIFHKKCHDINYNPDLYL